MEKLKTIYASAYAATISVIVTTVVTLAAELSHDFKTRLAGFTGHHWVTKSWLVIIVFALSFIFVRSVTKSPDPARTRLLLSILALAIILGSLVILGFYGYEFFIPPYFLYS